jgi:hypothetical protein
MKKIIYTGIFLTEDSKRILLSKVKTYFPNTWKIYADHLTLGYGENALYGEIGTFFEENKGKSIDLTIYSIGISDKAIAVGVKGNFKCGNIHPHITIATPFSGAPKYSNYIENWKDFKEPFVITGIIDSFPRI